MNYSPITSVLVALALLSLLVTPSAVGQGIALPAAGPINQSMGGAAVAAPIDAMGALFWNPATISGLQSSEMSFGLGLLLPTETLSSTIPASSIFPGFPPVTLSGSDTGEPGVMPIPTAAFVHHSEDSCWTYGIGIFGIGGFSTNYPASLTNPVLTPQAPIGLGLGHVSAQVEILQVIPTVSVAVTDRLSVGFSPTVVLGRLTADPLFLAAPDDANGDTFATYPAGTSTRYSWGLGAHLGVFYTGDNCWNWGASIKTPQWFEEFRANSSDELGLPRLLKTKFDFPMIVSVGTAYTGFERLILATDVRYFDYRNTDGFRGTGFNADGSVAGIGWKSIFAIATGAQFQATDLLAVRMGYAFNQNPISNSVAFFNVASPLITQHVLSVGASYEFIPGCLCSLTYAHAFENSVSGPIISPLLGPIPGSSATSEVSADALYGSISLRF